MRKRTVRTVLAALAGALVGGLLVFSTLVKLGGGEPSASPSPPAIPVGTPRVSPMVSPPTTAPTPLPSPEGRVVVDPLRVSFVLPSGYRVAEALNALSAGKSPAQFTITKADVAREEEYLQLLRDLAARQVATDAPTLSPGITMTLHEVTHPTTEEGDASFARGKEGVKTASGLLGTRYRRVEGIQTYDVTYFTLPGGERFSLQMVYSSAEPRFDEEAYAGVLDSLRPL